MQYKSELPWARINDFLLRVGRKRTSRDLCLHTLQEIVELVPYDIAALYLLREDGKSYEQILAGMEPKWCKAYLDYYSKVEGGRFSYFKDVAEEKDWNDYKHSEFATDYMRPQKINYSTTLKFFSADHCLRGALGLNRSCRSGFTQCEKETLSIIRAHLSNLHRNLFVAVSANENTGTSRDAEKPLTKRESQIAELLCKGISPKQISKKYFLSQRTVYKHIENIHQKLDVSSRQELLVKLLNKN